MRKYIVRFKGTPPDHYDAPLPRLLEADDKPTAIECAGKLALRDGLIVSSVRTYFGTHEVIAERENL